MATKEEKTNVDFNDRVTVYGTGGPGNTLEKGKAYEGASRTCQDAHQVGPRHRETVK